MSKSLFKSKLFCLFIAFAKVGLMTFGGGYAMIPILQKEIVEKYEWVTDEELMDYYAIGQCTPGIIAINTATFVGHKVKGKLGGVIATLGIITPSLLIILAISSIIDRISDYSVVQSAFSAVRCCVIVLIINAIIKLSRNAIKDIVCFIICLVVFTLSVFFDISPIIFVVFCAITGLVTNKVKGE